MITVPLIRDYKKEKKAEGWGWEKIRGMRYRKQKKLGNTREGGVTK